MVQTQAPYGKNDRMVQFNTLLTLDDHQVIILTISDEKKQRYCGNTKKWPLYVMPVDTLSCNNTP